MTQKLLSKSKYLIGEQCEKYLWTATHESKNLSPVNAATQYRFDQGQLVGRLAKKLYLNGIDMSTVNFADNIKLTNQLLRKRKPLFEAGVLVDKIYARADILNPVGIDEWDVIEVKSATKLKDVNLDDITFQKYCYEKAGLKIRNYMLMYVNNEYVKNGVINPEEFFKVEDVTTEVNSLSKGIENKVNKLLKVLSSTKKPSVKIGKQCKKPYACPLIDYCWDFLPDNNVFDLYRGGNKSIQLFEEDILAIKDIPQEFSLTDRQKIQKETEITGEPHINKKAIKKFLKTLKEPLYYLDFETISPVIPLFDGTKPYQRIPFQFSLHIVDEKKDTITHKSFLHNNPKDPRPKFLSALEKTIGKKGSIVVYNQAFEKSIMEELAQAFPEHSSWTNPVIKRMVDLLVPFRNFDYYNPSQHGSASIKKVLPALTAKSYEELGIKQGQDASLEYLKMIYGDIKGKLSSKKEIQKTRKNLEEYCSQDTKAMIWIVDELNKLVK